jgi:hypothetical protein
MNTNALIITLAVLAIGFSIFNYFARKIQLKKIRREKQELEEMREVAEQMDMHMASVLIHHDYSQEEVVNMLLEGIKRHNYDEKMAATTFALYNSVTALADSARENGIIK